MGTKMVLPFTAFFLHFDVISEKIQILAVAPSQFQRIVADLSTFEAWSRRWKWSSAKLCSSRKRTDTDAVSSLNPNP